MYATYQPLLAGLGIVLLTASLLLPPALPEPAPLWGPAAGHRRGRAVAQHRAQCLAPRLGPARVRRRRLPRRTPGRRRPPQGPPRPDALRRRLARSALPVAGADPDGSAIYSSGQRRGRSGCSAASTPQTVSGETSTALPSPRGLPRVALGLDRARDRPDDRGGGRRRTDVRARLLPSARPLRPAAPARGGGGEPVGPERTGGVRCLGRGTAGPCHRRWRLRALHPGRPHGAPRRKTTLALGLLLRRWRATRSSSASAARCMTATRRG